MIEISFLTELPDLGCGFELYGLQQLIDLPFDLVGEKKEHAHLLTPQSMTTYPQISELMVAFWRKSKAEKEKLGKGIDKEISPFFFGK